MYYIYFLYSHSSDLYYIGHSDDVDRRLQEHNESTHSTYTCKHRPWNLVYSFPVSDSRGDAQKIEKFIKKQKSRKLILKIKNKLGFKDFEWILKK